MVLKSELKEDIAKLYKRLSDADIKHRELTREKIKFEESSDEFQDRVKTLESQRNDADKFMRTIMDVINGEAKPESKIDVLKDILKLNHHGSFTSIGDII